MGKLALIAVLLQVYDTSVKKRGDKYVYTYNSDLIIPGLVTNGNCQNMLSWLDFSAILKHYGH